MPTDFDYAMLDDDMLDKSSSKSDTELADARASASQIHESEELREAPRLEKTDDKRGQTREKYDQNFDDDSQQSCSGSEHQWLPSIKFKNILFKG